MTDPTTSELAGADGYFRLLFAIRARMRALEFHLDTLGSREVQARFRPVYLEHKLMLQELEEDLLCLDESEEFRSRLRQLNKEFSDLGSTAYHMTQVFGTYKRPSSSNSDLLARRVMSASKDKTKDQRVRDWISRVYLEQLDKGSRGWFTFFDTLTISDAHMGIVTDRKNRAFEKYIKRWKWISGEHTYFCVTEFGGTTGRLHFHLIHWCRDLHRDALDPNLGRLIPDHRIVDVYRRCWPHGFSSPIAARLDASDCWARLGWRWPVEKKELGGPFTPLEASNPLRLARYLGKYITKQQAKEFWPWRIKTSQRLGTRLIRKTISRLSSDHLDILLSSSNRSLTKIHDLRIPIPVLRKLTLQEKLRRQSRASTEWATLLPAPTLPAQLNATLTSKIRTSREHRSTTCTETPISKGTATSEIYFAFEACLAEAGHVLNPTIYAGVTR